MTAKTIHSMIRVLGEKRTVAFYEKAFGLKVADRYAMDSSTIVYLRNPKSPFEVELTINNDQSEPYDIGDGYGHLALLVEDLDVEHARLRSDGLAPGDIKELDLGGKARFFFLKDPDGYQIEVLGPSGRFASLR